MRIHVLKRKSSALEGERGRPVVNTVVLPEFRVASLGEHAACLDVVDVSIRKPPLADCGGRKQRTAKAPFPSGTAPLGGWQIAFSIENRHNAGWGGGVVLSGGGATTMRCALYHDVRREGVSRAIFCSFHA